MGTLKSGTVGGRPGNEVGMGMSLAEECKIRNTLGKVTLAAYQVVSAARVSRDSGAVKQICPSAQCSIDH